jgi:polyphosphate kinase 2 (PPK2 family)
VKLAFRERGARVRLEDIPAGPPKGLTREDAQKRFEALGAELSELQDAMFGARLNSVIVVLQGRDGAGKDGTIKHVAGCLNPRGVSVTSFGVPTPEEQAHDFLWRVHRHAPRLGEFALFNRSHYEDVLVVRVHGLAPRKLWQQRYGHIADFEELLSEHGAIVLKYFLHISRKEQKERLLERERSPQSAWKLNPNDWLRSPGPRPRTRRGSWCRPTRSGTATWSWRSRSSIRCAATARTGSESSRPWVEKRVPSWPRTARRARSSLKEPGRVA